MSVSAVTRRSESTAPGPRIGQQSVRDVSRRDDTARQTTLRVLSYNILYGLRWDAVRELVQADPADIICLQEVPAADHRWTRAVRPQRIIDDLGLPNDCAMLWRKTQGRVGNMTLVRGGRIEPGRVLHVPPSQPYGMVNRVTVGGVGLVVANVHFAEMLGPPLLSFPFSEVFRLREACHLTRTLRRARVPVIAAGDFNTFWPAPATWPLRWHWRDCRRAVGGLGRATRPTYGLPFIIDNILVRGDADILDYEVIDGPGSDHRAIAATVRVVKSE